jgi:hypothetical protein
VGAITFEQGEEAFSVFWGGLDSGITLARTVLPQAFVQPSLDSFVVPLALVDGWMVVVATFLSVHPNTPDDSALSLLHLESGAWTLWRKSRRGGWAVSPSGSWLAWRSDAAVEVFDLRTRTLVASIGLSAEPRGAALAINDAGAIVVTNGHQETQCLALDGRVLSRWPDANANWLILAEDDPAVFSISRNQVLQHQWQGPTLDVSLPSHRCVAIEARTRRAFFLNTHDFSFAEIDLTSGQACSRGRLPEHATIAVDFENRRLAVMNLKTGGTVRIFSIT